MNYTIKEGRLKNLGYAYIKIDIQGQKFKTYQKKIGSNTIYLYQRGKQIIVNDWAVFTLHIIDFYREKVDHPIFFKKRTNGDIKGYMRILVSYTGEIKLYDDKLYNKCIRENDMTKFHNKYRHHKEIILYKKDMDLLLEEIERISN